MRHRVDFSSTGLIIDNIIGKETNNISFLTKSNGYTYNGQNFHLLYHLLERKTDVLLEIFTPKTLFWRYELLCKILHSYFNLANCLIVFFEFLFFYIDFIHISFLWGTTEKHPLILRAKKYDSTLIWFTKFLPFVLVCSSVCLSVYYTSLLVLTRWENQYPFFPFVQ